MSMATEQPSLQKRISAPTDTLEQEDDPEYPMGTTAQLPGLQVPRGECATSLARECQPGRARASPAASRVRILWGTRNTPFKLLECKR